MMHINLSDIAILNSDSVDYRCFINGSKSETVNSLENAYSSEKSGSL